MLRAISIFVFLLLSAYGCQAIDRDDEIRMAEGIVARNGCSDLSPLGQRVDPFARRSFKFLIKHELNCRAIVAVPLKESSGFAWLIVFYLEHWCPECSGERRRGILIGADGGKFRLVKKISKLPRNWKAD
jgi:hypothetical protein